MMSFNFVSTGISEWILRAWADHLYLDHALDIYDYDITVAIVGSFGRTLRT